MYFSESTLKLIEEVKKREILYNTKYEKRPKPEKEEAWKEVGANLNRNFELFHLLKLFFNRDQI